MEVSHRMVLQKYWSLGFTKGNRTWLPVHNNYKVLNLQTQNVPTRASLYNSYRSLTQLRKSSRALQEGTLKMKVVKFKADYCYNCEILVVSREVPGEIVTLFMSFSPILNSLVNLKEHMTIYDYTYVEADAFRPKR